MNLWKKVALGLFGIIVFMAFTLFHYMEGVGDLRTKYAKTKGPSVAAQKKGRILLQECISAMGGVEHWKRIKKQTIKITFQHDWDSFFLRTFFMPLEFSGQRLSLLLKPGEASAHLTFLTGKWKNKRWGIHKKKTYEKLPDGTLIVKPNKTITFNVLSYRFFFFLPFYLSEAKLVTYAGTRKLHGSHYNLIYITWGKWTPQRNVDQYLLWINQKTKRVDFVQSTVRDKFARSITTATLRNYQTVLGVKLPFSIKILQDIRVVDNGMHHMKLMKVEPMKNGTFPMTGTI